MAPCRWTGVIIFSLETYEPRLWDLNRGRCTSLLPLPFYLCDNGNLNIVLPPQNGRVSFRERLWGNSSSFETMHYREKTGFNWEQQRLAIIHTERYFRMRLGEYSGIFHRRNQCNQFALGLWSTGQQMAETNAIRTLVIPRTPSPIWKIYIISSIKVNRLCKIKRISKAKISILLHLQWFNDMHMFRDVKTLCNDPSCSCKLVSVTKH